MYMLTNKKNEMKFTRPDPCPLVVRSVMSCNVLYMLLFEKRCQSRRTAWKKVFTDNTDWHWPVESESERSLNIRARFFLACSLGQLVATGQADMDWLTDRKLPRSCVSFEKGAHMAQMTKATTREQQTILIPCISTALDALRNRHQEHARLKSHQVNNPCGRNWPQQKSFNTVNYIRKD